MRAFCSSQVYYSNITGSSAKEGSFLCGEAILNGSILLQNIQVTDIIAPKTPSSMVIKVSSGTLIMTNPTFKNIKIPLFQFDSTVSTLAGIKVEGLSCETSLSFCILGGSLMTLKLSDSQFENIVSNKGLMLMETPTDISLKNIQITNVERSKSESSTTELYALRTTGATKFAIEDSRLSNLDLSYFSSKLSNIKITNTIFSNKINKRTLAVTQTSEETEGNLCFLNLDSSNSTISGSSFFANAPFGETNDGVRRVIF